ncbi:hypothetical protein Tco_0488093 [Tanacetum coccineum]
MLDYGFNFMNKKIYIDNESTICIVKNPVFHSKTKHIKIRHHFIRDAYEKKLIQVLKIHSDDNVADVLTKAFDVNTGSPKLSTARPKLSTDSTKIESMKLEAMTSRTELASPKQTALGKDISNPLIVDSLLKTIWLSIHHVIAIKHWPFQSKRLLVPKSENKKAGAVSKITSTNFAHLTKQVLVEELSKKSIDETEVLAIVEEEGDTWMTPIYKYLTEETLPTEKEKERAIRCKSRCMHAGIRSVVEKSIRTGYYWPTMHANARKMIREIFPGSLPRAKKLVTKTDSHHVPVAILQMGNRHSQTFLGRT